MRCIDHRVWIVWGGLALLGACSSPMPGSVERSPSSTAASPTPAAPGPSGRLGAPEAARNWAELRRQAAQRLMAANPERTYGGAVPDPLLAIPVLEIELNGDGSIRGIEVLRVPTQAKDTVQIAIDAVRRAAPFGSVARLPKPWKFSETFLFNDERKFKPRTLDS